MVNAPRLKMGVLTLPEIISSSLANIAPAIGFFFSASLIAGAAGQGMIWIIIVASIAMYFHVNTLSEFSKAVPSTGSYVSFVGRSFGGAAASATAFLVSVSYIIGIGAIMTGMGFWTATILQKFLGLNVPWQVIMTIFVALTTLLAVTGIKLSTRWVIGVFFFELTMLVITAVAILIGDHQSISASVWSLSSIKGGLAGVGLGFPIAIYLFVGVGNSVPLAEETSNPRTSIPRAVVLSLLFAMVIYIIMSWATLVGFGNNAAHVAAHAIPFVDAGAKVLGPFAILVYLAGFTSAFACLIGATNGQARMIFSGARDQLLPGFLAKVSPRYHTPWSAIAFYAIAAWVMTMIWSISATGPNLFGYTGTLGTIGVLVVYAVVNLALPVFYYRERRHLFSFWRHLVFPLLGIAAIALPFWGLIQPGQPAPFNVFPAIGAGFVILAIIWGIVVRVRNPQVDQQAGRIIADEA